MLGRLVRPLNNHRNRLKQLCDLYLYNHFNSDGHNITGLNIMPIEEVVLTADDNLTLASKLLTREEHWIKELGLLYPYGLNDNISETWVTSPKSWVKAWLYIPFLISIIVNIEIELVDGINTGESEGVIIVIRVSLLH